MFHPVGSQPPSVYWRRRVVLLGSAILLVVLIVLTLNVLFSGNSKPAAQSATPPTNSTPAAQPSSRSTATSTHSSASSSTQSRSASGSSKVSGSSSSSAPPAPCAAKSLSLAAESNRTSYTVRDQPVLSIVVTNTGNTACVQDLADRQIVLRIYNGESRVWGSHDCKIEPGTDDRTLMAGHSVRVSVAWGGLSSQPKCAGQRQPVGAGSYTLYASLAGHEGKAAQFTIG